MASIDLLLLFFAAPAPENVRAFNISNDKIQVTWDPFAPNLLTNLAKHYEISKSRGTRSLIQKADGSATNTTFPIQKADGAATQTTFLSLDIFTEYCFQVRVVLQSDTKGNQSTKVCARTEEDGMY